MTNTVPTPTLLPIAPMSKHDIPVGLHLFSGPIGLQQQVRNTVSPLLIQAVVESRVNL